MEIKKYEILGHTLDVKLKYYNIHTSELGLVATLMLFGMLTTLPREDSGLMLTISIRFNIMGGIPCLLSR